MAKNKHMALIILLLFLLSISCASPDLEIYEGQLKSVAYVEGGFNQADKYILTFEGGRVFVVPETKMRDPVIIGETYQVKWQRANYVGSVSLIEVPANGV